MEKHPLYFVVDPAPNDEPGWEVKDSAGQTVGRYLFKDDATRFANRMLDSSETFNSSHPSMIPNLLHGGSGTIHGSSLPAA